MKKILVGMDFSQGALNALDYAIEVAKNTQSEITLVWIEPKTNDRMLPGEKNEIRHEAKMDLQNIITEKQKANVGLKINFKQKKGRIYHEMASLAESVNADLVIIGTHGIGGFEEFWVGSNAFKIISYCPCPVISVRTDYQGGGKVRKIILPIDDTIDTTSKVPMAARLAKAFNAEIDILGVYDSDLSSIRKKTDQYVQKTERYLSENNIKHHFHHCKSNKLHCSIVNYAENNNADLMVIMTDQNKATSDIIMGRRAQQIINRSPIPVLSVKPDKMEFIK